MVVQGVYKQDGWTVENTYQSICFITDIYFGIMMYCYMNVVAKVGIKSCKGARECVSFVHVCMAYVATQLQFYT